MIASSIFRKKLKTKDGKCFMIVGQWEQSDSFIVYMYSQKPKWFTCISRTGPLYKKSWRNWTFEERRETAKSSRHFIVTEGYIRRMADIS